MCMAIKDRMHLILGFVPGLPLICGTLSIRMNCRNLPCCWQAAAASEVIDRRFDCPQLRVLAHLACSTVGHRFYPYSACAAENGVLDVLPLRSCRIWWPWECACM